MAGRGPQTFAKRQKEQQRKEKQMEKLARRVQRKQNKENGIPDAPEDDYNPLDEEDFSPRMDLESPQEP